METDRRRALVDRRAGTDRRNVYVLGYFINGGVERRSGRERRSQVERRAGWMRGENGCSVPVESDRSTY
jgi:hypothetical protein